jgi:hypothetical protein
MPCGEVNAEPQWEMSRFLAESALEADRKTVAIPPQGFAQVRALRILTVCGEVAERLKAAVC